MTDKEKAAREHSSRFDDTIGHHISFLAGAEWGEPKWIKCSERLPENNQWVLIIAADRWKFPTIGMWDKEKEWFIPDSDHVSGYQYELEVYPLEIITHWMPLPEAPKEEE